MSTQDPTEPRPRCKACHDQGTPEWSCHYCGNAAYHVAHKGTTTQQRERYLDAVASKAAQCVREDAEPRESAIDYAFSYVDPTEYFAPTMAAAMANAQTTDDEYRAVAQRVHTLLTLGRAVPTNVGSVPLTRRMPNGATVADWLGTAGTAARVAALKIADVREYPRDAHADRRLAQAEKQLVQALDEVRAVRAEVQR
jgi:hypothetical protein